MQTMPEEINFLEEKESRKSVSQRRGSTLKWAKELAERIGDGEGNWCGKLDLNMAAEEMGRMVDDGNHRRGVLFI